MKKSTLLSIVVFFIGFVIFVQSNDSTRHDVIGNAYGTQTDVSGVWGCSASDPECALFPVDGCDVRTVDAFNFPGGLLPLGIDICADSRVVDCSGATIRGNSLNHSYGIRNYGYHYTTISNCTILNFDIGILVVGSSNNFGSVRGSRIVNNKLINNVGAGLRLYYATRNSFINNNTFMDNRLDHIFLANSNGNVIQNNTIVQTALGISRGIALFSSSNLNNIFNNTIRNQQTAILVSSDDNVVKSNFFDSNIFGIYVKHYDYATKPTSNILSENIFTNNSYGMVFSNAGFNSVYKNILRKNNEGILLTESPQSVNQNIMCFNPQNDISISNGFLSNGTNNTCDKAQNWNDFGQTGCTYTCRCNDGTIDLDEECDCGTGNPADICEVQMSTSVCLCQKCKVRSCQSIGSRR